MKDNKKNGLYAGWPPFSEFKKEMSNLLSLQVNEYKKETNKKIENLTEGTLKILSVLPDINKKFSSIDKKLSNHITDTNKKIDKVTERFDDIETLIKKEKGI